MNHYEAAEKLAQTLLLGNDRVVFAESCTAGLAAAALGRTPGISNHLCGSAVVYRPETKKGWLGISADALALYTAESAPITEQLARGVLQKTEEANFSAAITGHLGPGAPAESDGIIYCAIARRSGEGINILCSDQYVLQAIDRAERQEEAAATLLSVLERQVSV